MPLVPRTLTRAEFERVRPQGRYENYLRFLARRRPGGVQAARAGLPQRQAAPDPFAALTGAQIQQRAQAETFDPFNRIIDASVQALVARAAQNADAQRARTSALVAALAPLAGRIRGTFDTAAGSVAADTARIAAGAQQQGQQLQGELASKLGQIQAPQQSVDQFAGGAARTGAGAAGALNALGSAELQRLRGQGSAEADFAAELPGIEQLRGLRELGLIQQGLSAELTETIGKLQTEAAKQYGEALRDFREAELEKAKARDSRTFRQAAQKQADARIRLSQSKQDFDRAATNARLGQGQQRIDDAASQRGVSNSLAAARLDLSRQSQIESLGLSRERLDLAREREARLQRGRRSGGFTASQLQRLKRDAFESVRDAKQGVVDDDGQVVLPPWTEKGGIRPQQVLKDLVGQGIPFSIAVRAVASQYPPAKKWFNLKPQRTTQGRTSAPLPGGAADGVLVPPPTFQGTHITDGLELNQGQRTAVDIIRPAGTPVGAPVDGTVVRHGSAQGGESLYLQGDDGSLYWLGHIDNQVPVGTHVRRGQVVASISADHPTPHLHIDRRAP